MKILNNNYRHNSNKRYRSGGCTAYIIDVTDLFAMIQTWLIPNK